MILLFQASLLLILSTLFSLAYFTALDPRRN